MADQSSEYTAKDIQVLEGLEGVRKRPAMYIGDIGKRGLHHLVYEISDNSVDEALAGHCKNIEITLHADGSVLVKDDGRGIPIDIHPKTGKSALEVVSGSLHAGGKFEKKAYKVSGGLHGVGMSVVNALSHWMHIEVHRDGKIHTLHYDHGKTQEGVRVTGETAYRGTIVRFKPDATIFQTVEFDFEYLKERFMELAFLNKGLRITLSDERTQKSEEFYYEGGIVQFVEYLNKARPRLHPPFYINKSIDSLEIEFALQYTESFNDMLYSFVNDIKTVEGGTHVIGFKTALTRAVNEYAKGNKLVKDDHKIVGDDALEGITAVISIKIPEPQFEGQTKTKLGNNEVKGVVDSIVYEALQTYLEENPDSAKKIAAKIVQSMEAREAAQKARDLIRRKNVFESSILPGKLADCEEEDPTKAELFLVEGDSAGGCFSGDTKVALADGRNVTFKDLIEEDAMGKRNFCYTIKKDGSIGIEEIKHPRITKRNVEVITVILDTGEKIECTPDHLFMLRDGTYRKARDLKPSDSLMPLQRKLSELGNSITIEGYEMVYDHKSLRWIFTHLLADNWNMENAVYPALPNAHRHHIDFNKLNNNPTNIRRLSPEEHLAYHRGLLEKTLHTPEIKEKCRKLKQTKEFREMMSKRMKEPSTRNILSKNARKQWEDQAYKEYMIKKFIDFYYGNKEYREKSLKILAESQRTYWSSEENVKKQSERIQKFFSEHPERKQVLSVAAKEQWQNEQLLLWRSERTKEQWTPEFRKKRMKAYNKAYYDATIRALRDIYDKTNMIDIDEYNQLRKKTKNKNLLLFETFAKRFFDNDTDSAKQAVMNYNHKVFAVINLHKQMDVYDIEVPNTHNFALANGVFVHNSSKMARDRRFQAILPLRGKILNVEKAPIHKTLASEGIKNVVLAIGAGFKDEFDLNKTRYHKIIITCDADVDGAHIRTLLLTLFYRYFKPVVEKGYIYVAQPPLYRVKKGKNERYVYNETELDAALKEFGEGCEIQRYKGLGEMNPDQLWHTTMDPATRTLKKVTIEDAMKADELFSILMGEEVEPRREFIESYAKEVKNLDI